MSATHGPSSSEAGRPTVAIIGGGFSGAVLAHQLVRRAPGQFRIVIVEPRRNLGGGVAYSTADPAHRINVPSSRMSFIPSDPCHFDRWLKADGALKDDPDALLPDGRAFPRRATFGRYSAETIEPYLLTGEIEHRCRRAETVRRSETGYEVELSDGERIAADHVALAATHPSPSPPPALEGLAGDTRMIVDTQDSAALGRVAPDARVLIVGCGLTMADIVASLAARGHRGKITAVSRRVRRTVRAAEQQGRPWQHVLDAARFQGAVIWAELPEAERRKVVRRLRAFWDVHRFRVAPQVEREIERLRADGALTVLKGEPVHAAARADALEVEIRLRGGQRVVAAYDAVTLATGPAHRKLPETSPLIGQLVRDGLVSTDRIGLGLATDETSVALGQDGRPSESFWIAGPLARAAFGELMGLPEVARHAELVAAHIIRAEEVRARRSRLLVA
ncbi:FAD/NAD(P)-binding protein [Hansschlegelia zhihuaiae]|uniref:FAD-dependent urate hydroxylase HpyO/Asp monooxygenase CreE-like FAD/NAD(P)-binding domain-containing protein n=1 Tax=Hansschlegelia zhihuaiae TaxID=405005 RepID=A0A4Q0MEX6_9HYPH|nr:FAD/NAD(P)-binding protein [Hansschlegelia zhihuaiae]RXF72031.1 hypothetical protein EK403_14515 [Hansschlegelia zhihuaiae]